ncbi:hypothetical protein Tco_1398580 [Tanacetum coccineum]
MVEEVEATNEVVRAKIAADKRCRVKLLKEDFQFSDIYEFHPDNEVEGENSRMSSIKVKGNDEDKIEELA